MSYCGAGSANGGGSFSFLGFDSTGRFMVGASPEDCQRLFQNAREIENALAPLAPDCFIKRTVALMVELADTLL